MQRAHMSLSLVKSPDGDRASDAELGSALISGEPWAELETWNRFSPAVRKMAAGVLGADSEIPDVVQEVFCRLLRKAKTLRNPECLHPFVISFAVRVLKSELRRRRVRNWLSFDDVGELPEISAGAVDMESRDLLRKFYALLGRLGAREQLVYTLRNIEFMTIEETAAAMRLSTATVKRIQRRATSSLSRLLRTDPELLSMLRMKGRHDG